VIARPVGGALVAVTVLGASLAGCSSGEQHGSATTRVTAWVSDQQVGQTIGTLDGDGERIATAIREHQDTNILHTVCAVLEADTSSADGVLPAPDAEITDDLDKALHSELAVANDCFTGAKGDPSLLRRATSQQQRASALLGAVMARIVQVTGRTPSTTTTTSAGGDIPAL
jgi:hypothetical protein